MRSCACASASPPRTRCRTSAPTSSSGGCGARRDLRLARCSVGTGAYGETVVMAAAIRLLLSQVYVRNGRLYVEQLTVDDETAARLAADREDPIRFVTEAIEIGA